MKSLFLLEMRFKDMGKKKKKIKEEIVYPKSGCDLQLEYMFLIVISGSGILNFGEGIIVLANEADAV